MTSLSPGPPAPTPPPSDSKPARSPWQTAAQFSYIGIFFGVAVMVGAYGGQWIEDRWGGKPWVSLAGMLIGVAAGFRELYRIARRYTRQG
jgi:F0F1-type ATP synthase assembly protein I